MAANIYDMPDGIVPRSMDLTLASNTKLFESTFNKSTTTAKFAGDRWQMTMNFENLDDEIDALSVFIYQIGGMSGRVRVPPFHRLGKNAEGTPKVQGANNTGGLLTTDEWLPSRVVLKAGAFFQVGEELKMVTEDIVSDVNGNATLKFVPWLRSSPADGADIITNKPTGLFRLSDDEVTMSLEPQNGSVSISFTEAFYV